MKVKTSSGVIFWIAIFLLIGSGCAVSDQGVTPTSLTAQATSSGLSAEEAETLNSLEKIDDYPFYVMVYAGSYSFPEFTSRATNLDEFGCSLFAAFGETGDKLYGRNFDWVASPAMLVFTDPPDGYASASMVDLTFLGFTPEQAKALTDQSLKERIGLISAPSLPFDGMNEYGLSIGMAAIPEEYLDDTRNDPAKQTIGSIGIIRQVLDHARNVDEAIKLFEQYNLRYYGGPPIHYLLADRSGKAVLVEFYREQVIVLPNADNWHMATNHLRCIARGDGGCWRYHILSEKLSAVNGILDNNSAMQLLADVKQENTQWSAVYNMTSGDILVVIGQEYQNPYTFHLKLADQ